LFVSCSQAVMEAHLCSLPRKEVLGLQHSCEVVGTTCVDMIWDWCLRFSLRNETLEGSQLRAPGDEDDGAGNCLPPRTPAHNQAQGSGRVAGFFDVDWYSYLARDDGLGCIHV